MQKAYNRIVWHNKPDTRSPINESNLNRMDIGLDTVDDRVITLDTTKANQTDLLTCVASITFNQSTGILTITLQNGTSTTIDTGLSKLAVNFDYDDDPTSPHYEQLILEMKDGTYKYIDLSALINQFEFDNTSTVVFSVDAQTGHISAIVPDGSITESKLQPNFLADCRTEKTQAQAARAGAETAESNAEGFTEDAEAWANGEINGEPVPDTHPAYHNNAKYYKDLANPTTFKALTDVTTDQNFNGIDMSGIQDGQTIVFDNTTGEMVPGDAGGAAINDIVNIYGAKNFYAIDKSDNVLCTINDDGSISLSGTVPTMDPNDLLEIELFTGTEKDRIPAGDYILDASLIGTSAPARIANGVYVYFYYDFIGHPAWTQTKFVQLDSNYATETHKTRDFTIASSEYEYYVSKCCLKLSGLLSGSTLNSTIKIMVYDANLKTDKFVPYAMTNRQLTLKHNVKDMNDAVINNPTPGQTLVYNSDGKLENATPSGSGHTILDSAGTALTPRTNLQFAGGLNATDDSSNNKSVVDDNYEIIPWTTWQGYTAAQKAQHPNVIVTDAPDCDGDVEIENLHPLWTNPSPTSAFATQNVTLSSGDYDLRVVEWYDYVGNNVFYTAFPKGKNSKLVYAYDSTTSPYNATGSRTITHVSDTVLTFGSAELYYPSGHNTNDGFCVPIAIYGQNKQITAKIKAIAHDVSTLASKCMMSDEQTSVEDMVTTDGLHNVTTTSNVYVSEYFNYFKIGKLVVVNIGGVADNTGLTAVKIGTGLPVMRSRALAVIANDSTPSTYSCIVFGSIGNTELYLSTHTANIGYFGQLVYYTD